ncbi:MAG: phosphoribosylamine--glycine ligase [Candidatus Omnitrophica bacterium]|nr:phosphoribosylamine--glycine ligase [Candidatus Omnitrophota bacterium]MDD4012998.1 phosphoribosylamine--glycine ligase [Candidatus Omnitrophota bacterium]
MNILVIGSGGREHAICWKLRQSRLVKDIFCSPGNAGTAVAADNVVLDTAEHSAVIDLCRRNRIDLVIVGPEAPLAMGIADDLAEAGIRVFGPKYEAARLESSKIFAKEMMGGYSIPTAGFRVFEDFKKVEPYLDSAKFPLVVKAYGLAAGKGVAICSNSDEALAVSREMLVERKFGSAGQKIIIEEFLAGEEASILVVTDGKNIIPLVSSQDHKRVFDGDEGPNTGGMGAYSPAPVVDDRLLGVIMDTIIEPTIKGLSREGFLYRGVLYAGIMVTSEGPKVLEYNVRFGDPETQVILPRLKSDLAELAIAAAEGDISGIKLEWDASPCGGVVLASGGYPGEYEKGRAITGIEDAEKEGVLVFHAGTAMQNGKVVTDGGRVMVVSALGKDIKEAMANAYRGVKKIHFEGMHYRKDIGYRAIQRMKA